MRVIRALRDCKQRSLTVSKKAPTVSKKASPDFKSLGLWASKMAAKPPPPPESKEQHRQLNCPELALWPMYLRGHSTGKASTHLTSPNKKSQSRPSEFSTAIGPWWVARLKISISLEQGAILRMVSIFGPWGCQGQAARSGTSSKATAIVLEGH